MGSDRKLALMPFSKCDNGGAKVKVTIHQYKPDGNRKIPKTGNKPAGDFYFTIYEVSLKQIKQDDPSKLVKIDSSETIKFQASMIAPDPRVWNGKKWIDLKDEGILTVRFNLPNKSVSKPPSP